MTPNAAKLKGLLLTGALIMLSVIHSMAADTGNAVWSKGNQLYQQKQYDSALACFQQVAVAHPRVAEVYYNIGNTYYKLNRIGPAVLNYEKALHLNPDYTEARENLQLTQNRISNRVQGTQDIFFVNWWQRITKASLANMWAILALGTFATILLIMAVNRYRKNNDVRIPAQVTGILYFAFLCMLILAFFSAQNATNTNMAVVMQNDAPLMNADLKGKAQSLVPEGTTVKINTIKGDYADVTLADGRRGWLQYGLLSKI